MKPLQYKTNVKPGICTVRYCNKKTEGRKMCASCRCKKSRIEDPVRYAFNNLRNRAKQRGIKFTITLEEFREWCTKVTYIGFSGRSAHSFTIDRKHNDVGYHIDNIQVLTKKDNIKKYVEYDYREKKVFITNAIEVPEGTDLPF